MIYFRGTTLQPKGTLTGFVYIGPGFTFSGVKGCASGDGFLGGDSEPIPRARVPGERRKLSQQCPGGGGVPAQIDFYSIFGLEMISAVAVWRG